MSTSTAELRELKEMIEGMSHHHQIEVLRILHDKNHSSLNENQNGTFVNLTLLCEETIIALKEYADYVKDQQQTLAVIEARKKQIQNKYFKGVKDKTIDSTI
tara:strand:- start:22 stop:327 length:306 start_codon:yes stop_codon:yes gene_type:complete